MEIKEKQQVKKGTKKFNVKIDTDKITSNLFTFYKDHIALIHLIVFIIGAALFVVTFFSTFIKIKNGQTVIDGTTTTKSVLDMLKEDALISFVIIFAGITPYCFLSVIGLIQILLNVQQYALRYALGNGFMLTSFLGILLQVIGITLCVAVGLYYCRLSTKKRKYYNQSGFGMDDIKASIYDLRKDENKLKELQQKREEKARKIEEANVKIPYFNFILLGLIGFVVEVIGTLIAAI